MCTLLCLIAIGHLANGEKKPQEVDVESTSSLVDDFIDTVKMLSGVSKTKTKTKQSTSDDLSNKMLRGKYPNPMPYDSGSNRGYPYDYSVRIEAGPYEPNQFNRIVLGGYSTKKKTGSYESIYDFKVSDEFCPVMTSFRYEKLFEVK